MDLPTRSIRENRSSADSVGRWVTLVGVAVTLTFSDSETRDVTRVEEIRSDLTPVKMLPSKVEGLDVGFLGGDLQEASEGEGEADGRLHLGGEACGEDDTGVGCH